MECPYDKEPCSQINTATMTFIKQCYECERYNHGIIPNGDTPILAEILKKFDEIKNLIIKLL